jgi:hypothetical protein
MYGSLKDNHKYPMYNAVGSTELSRPMRNFIVLIRPIRKQGFDPFFKVVCLLFSLLVIVGVLKVIG